MIKKVLIIVAVLTVIVIGIVAWAYSKVAPNENRFLDYFEDHPETTAIHLVRDGEVIASQNPDKMMPLASTVKIIIAIEYAMQAAAGEIDPDEIVPLIDLEHYYAPRTDGGAHPAWLSSVKKSVVNDGIPLREVALGMIRYSSNANTEYLCHTLGLDRINQRLDSLGIVDHSPIYYIVSALYVSRELFPDLTDEDLASKLRELSDEEYIDATSLIHDKLTADTSYRKNIGELAMSVQRVWSDRLPASTVAEYAKLMGILNSSAHLSPPVSMTRESPRTERAHTYLREVMESIMENPANQAWLDHSGGKGGSTAFVLTKAMYATDKQGQTTELAYFMDDMSLVTSKVLPLSLNEFELQVLRSPEFVEKLGQTIGK